jgi:hypothetical protein
MSPHFVYRVDPLTEDKASSGDVRPLSPYELANRLSYFLWSSMPDDELMKHAAAATCRSGCSLRRRGGCSIATFGSWRRIRRQLARHPPVRRTQRRGSRAIPGFTSQLREAMFEEPIRFVQDVIQRDGSVLDFLYGNYTFVNPILAKHYGCRSRLRRDRPAWTTRRSMRAADCCRCRSS